LILAIVAGEVGRESAARAHRLLAGLLPVVAVLGEGAFACDLRGTARLLGAPRVVAHRALTLVGEPFAAGLATRPFTARLLAAQTRPGEVRELASAEEERAFLRAQALEVLPLDPLVLDELALLGLRDVGAFADLPMGPVLDRFGLAAAHAHALARNEDPAVLVGAVAPVRLAAGRRFDFSLESLEPLLFAVRVVVDEIAERLRGSGFAALRLAARLEREDAHPLRLERLVLPPTAEPAALLRSLRWALEERADLGRVVGIELEASAVEPARGRQLGLFAPDGARKEDAQAVAAYLRSRLGPRRVLRARVVDEEPRLFERASEFEEVVS
jgi:nucleotidyltransferase/DNA polymerase involved in DNA repair